MPALRSIVIIILLLLSQRAPAQTTPSREYVLKAVFLYNFTQFVNWPADAFASPQSPLVIGILGENPFGNYLEQTVKDEKISEHDVVVKYCQDEEDAKDCHILFINLRDAQKYMPVIEALKGKNILTVSDAPNFSKQGGMISFLNKENKIKLQVNLGVSESAGLTLSSKLLRIAEIVQSNENE